MGIKTEFYENSRPHIHWYHGKTKNAFYIRNIELESKCLDIITAAVTTLAH